MGGVGPPVGDAVADENQLASLAQKATIIQLLLPPAFRQISDQSLARIAGGRQALDAAMGTHLGSLPCPRGSLVREHPLLGLLKEPEQEALAQLPLESSKKTAVPTAQTRQQGLPFCRRKGRHQIDVANMGTALNHRLPQGLVEGQGEFTATLHHRPTGWNAGGKRPHQIQAAFRQQGLYPFGQGHHGSSIGIGLCIQAGIQLQQQQVGLPVQGRRQRASFQQGTDCLLGACPAGSIPWQNQVRLREVLEKEAIGGLPVLVV